MMTLILKSFKKGYTTKIIHRYVKSCPKINLKYTSNNIKIHKLKEVFLKCVLSSMCYKLLDMFLITYDFMYM